MNQTHPHQENGAGWLASTTRQTDASSNESDDDGNSDSAMTTLPIGERIGSLQRQVNLTYFYGNTTMSGGRLSKVPQNYHADNNNRIESAAASTTILDAVTGQDCAVSDVIDDMLPMNGRSLFAFWTIVIIMFVLALGNLALTVSIVGVLRMGRGIEFMELVPEADTIKFYGETDLDRVYKRDGRIEGFADVPVSITGDNAAVQIALLRANSHPHSRLTLSKNGTAMHGFNVLDVRSPSDGTVLFSTHRPHFTMPSGADNIRAKIISTSRLTSAIDQSLTVNQTRGRIVLRGTEGVSLRGAQITLAADQNVWLRSLNGTLSLRAAAGVFVDVTSMPLVGEHDGVKLDSGQYKLCVCMPQGRVFRVPVPTVGHAGSKHGLCSRVGRAGQPDPCA